MALSDARICNIALLRVGHRDRINSLAESSAAARACSEVFEECRDQVLEDFDWPFAHWYQALAQVVDDDLLEATGWAWKYSLPTDCVKPRFIYAGGRAPAAKDRIPFTVVGNAKGIRYLLTDHEGPVLHYTTRVENVSVYPPNFVNALAWKLASELALSLPVKPQLGLAAAEHYKAALHNAIGRVLEGEQEDVEPESDFITVRR